MYVYIYIYIYTINNIYIYIYIYTYTSYVCIKRMVFSAMPDFTRGFWGFASEVEILHLQRNPPGLLLQKDLGM